MKFSYAVLSNVYREHGEKRVYFECAPSSAFIRNRSAVACFCKIYFSGDILGEFTLNGHDMKKIMCMFDVLTISTMAEYCLFKITAIYDITIIHTNNIPAMGVIDKPATLHISVMDELKLLAFEEARKTAIKKIEREIEDKVRREWHDTKLRLKEEEIRQQLIDSGQLTFEEDKPRIKKKEDEDIFET